MVATKLSRRDDSSRTDAAAMPDTMLDLPDHQAQRVAAFVAAGALLQQLAIQGLARGQGCKIERLPAVKCLPQDEASMESDNVQR